MDFLGGFGKAIRGATATAGLVSLAGNIQSGQHDDVARELKITRAQAEALHHFGKYVIPESTAEIMAWGASLISGDSPELKFIKALSSGKTLTVPLDTTEAKIDAVKRGLATLAEYLNKARGLGVQTIDAFTPWFQAIQKGFKDISRLRPAS